MTPSDVQVSPAAPLSPRGRFFASQTFHFETLRNAGYVFSQCADLGEILETVKLIEDGSVQSWYAAWSATADRLVALAERTRDSRSKGEAYMRASTYQRTAEFLLLPDDPKRPESFERTTRYFFNGLDTLGVRYEHYAAPYGNARLRALYLPGPAGSEAKPLLIVVGGFDSILEELYPVLGKAALERGYSVLMYEGPGQGEALRKYGLTLTSGWERPHRAVFEEFLRSHKAPVKTVVIGMSLGGYLAPRAAAFDEGIDGVVAYDTCFDVSEIAKRTLSNPASLNNPDVAWGYHNALWTLGTKNIADTAAAVAGFRLAPVAERIRQDVLILAGVDGHFIPFHQTAEFEKALVGARSVTTRVFDRPSGGAGHCQCGNLSLVHAALFDWLLEKFPVVNP